MRREQWSQAIDDRLEFMGCDPPNDVVVDREVLVHDTMTKRGDLRPGEDGVLRFEFIRHTPRGFADDLKGADEREL